MLFREIKSLSLEILEEVLDVDTKVVEWFKNVSIDIKISQNLITKHNRYMLIVSDLRKICTITFIIKNHDFKIKIIICDIELDFVSIDFLEQDQFLWVCDRILLIRELIKELIWDRFEYLCWCLSISILDVCLIDKSLIDD